MITGWFGNQSLFDVLFFWEGSVVGVLNFSKELTSSSGTPGFDQGPPRSPCALHECGPHWPHKWTLEIHPYRLTVTTHPLPQPDRTNNVTLRKQFHQMNSGISLAAGSMCLGIFYVNFTFVLMNKPAWYLKGTERNSLIGKMAKRQVFPNWMGTGISTFKSNNLSYYHCVNGGNKIKFTADTVHRFGLAKGFYFLFTAVWNQTPK